VRPDLLRSSFSLRFAAFVLMVALLDSRRSIAQLKVAPHYDKVLGYCVMCHRTDYLTLNSRFFLHSGFGGRLKQDCKSIGSSST
jgi:hypothetical protein